MSTAHHSPTTTDPIVRPAWLSQETWPFTIRTHDTGLGRIAYTDEGAGPILVLVHSGTWSVLWRDLAASLHKDFRVITFDPPATGLSDTGDGAGLGQTADALDSLVRSLELTDIVIVAHDLGGPASLQAVSHWPERVRGYVAVNCFGWRPSGPVFRAMLWVMGSGFMRESDAWTGWLPAATSTRFGAGSHWSRTDRHAFRRGMDRRGRRSFHRNMRSALRHDYTAVDRGRIALVAKPILTVFGQRNDPLRFQPRWREAGRMVEQVMVPRGYHFPMCDDPQLVARILIDWHQRNVGARAS
ncbi:MAG: alpha/beta fold hydrolase [Actinomycetota bacterium]|nr:alpha/beta fold hydrolase [Actinomycetota bacterium]